MHTLESPFVLKKVSRINIIVPCFNPLDGWEHVLCERFLEFEHLLEIHTSQLGLILVDDGSMRVDVSPGIDFLKEQIPHFIAIRNPQNRGKGHALRLGVQASDADLHLLTDTDFPYELESMLQIVTTLLAQGGVAAGNRAADYYTQVPWVRKILSKGLRWTLRHLLLQPVEDSQCGLKGFDNRGKALFLETTIDRFLFDLEFLMMAKKRIPVTPVPVVLRKGVVFSKVNMHVLLPEVRNFLYLMLKR